MLQGLWVNELNIEYTIHSMKKKFKICVFLGSDCRNELLFFEGYVLFHFTVELLFKIVAVKVCVSVNVTDGNLQKM